MRMDQGNTMRPEPALYNAAFLSYGLPLGVQVSGRHNSQNIHSRGPHIHLKDAYGSGEHDAARASPLRKIYILEGHTSTQKMRMDQGNTMRPELAYDAAFLSYGRN